MFETGPIEIRSDEDRLNAFRSELAKRHKIGPLAEKAKSFDELRREANLGDDTFADELADMLDLPRIAFDDLQSCQNETARFSTRFLRETRIWPFLTSEGNPALAVSEPPSSAVLHAAELIFQTLPRLFITGRDTIEILLNDAVEHEIASEDTNEADPNVSTDLDSLRDMASGAPVVRAVNELIEKAFELNATDLHLEPMRDTFVARLRIDGLLRQIPAPPLTMAAGILSRIKILAGLNIAERRLPQDGSARMTLGGAKVDLRVAIMPSAHGETAVIRLLPRDRGLVEIGRIGLNEKDRSAMDRILAMPHGMVIITGPTGSGKTTTLAAALAVINEPHRKILTIEDPIEYDIPGICQSQVKPEIGLTFANALRSFVRQDPDVIMVGEVRDGETAGIAVNAALTGHLLLTTLHTETATAAIPRLIDLGIDDFLLQSTIRALIAQRLVRVLCPHCKTRVALTKTQIDTDPRYGFLGLKSGDFVCEPVGCDRCGGSGYRGRTGLFEILEPDAEIRSTFRRGTDATSIEMAAIRKGFRTMNSDAYDKVIAGITSTADVFRVTPQRFYG